MAADLLTDKEIENAKPKAKLYTDLADHAADSVWAA